MNQIFFNFYDVGVCIQTEWLEISELLSKDFSFFLSTKNTTKSIDYNVFLYEQDPGTVTIPCLVAKMQYLNYITYQSGHIRFNDYYGKLTSILDYSSNSSKLYSRDLNKMHEISYLLILSLVGKKLDLLGLHKIHAFAVEYKNIALVCMMPMKGGKSTLLLELLKNPLIKMISDDIPLVSRKGELLPFPIKIGVDNFKEDLIVQNPDQNIYTMNRGQYGPKTLISLRGIPDKVVSKDAKYGRVLLLEAFRYHNNHSVLEKVNFFRSFKGLFKHAVIGFGLPIVIEYFWEFGIKDFLKKMIIFFSRFSTLFIFSLHAKNYKLLLGKDVPQTANLIITLLENESERKMED